MSEQRTPRTDAAYTKGRKEHGNNIDGRFLDMDAHARQLESDLAEAVAALSNIDLSNYVNAADISAADVPHVVVEKLQKAIRAKHK